ncbi:MAG: hypothetical protein K2X87_27180 [Gemmataceae bacterium]|nr:hypothetical protein [Gemmataceae bacterium]
MMRALLLAALAGGLVVIPGLAGDGAEAPPPRPAARLPDAPADLGATDPAVTPLADVLRALARRHDLTFIIDNGAFKNPGAVAEAKPTDLPAGAAKLPVGRFLDAYLGALPVPEKVGYVVRPDYIEITSRALARPREEKDDGAKKGAKPGGSFDPGAAKLVNLLHNQPVSLGETDLQTTPLVDVLRQLSKTYDLTFVIDNTAFDAPAAVADAKATALSATKLDGLPLGRFLAVYLRGLSVPDVTYLVRDYGIEVTSREKALNEAGLVEAINEAAESDEAGAPVRAQARLNLPLVSVVAEDRPLGEVLKELARAYNLNLVIDRAVRERVGEAVVMARLLNVPADTALELLAEQADLQVIRKGNTFRITGGAGAQ